MADNLVLEQVGQAAESKLDGSAGGEDGGQLLNEAGT